MHVNMTEEFGIFIFSSILLVSYLTNSQTSTLNLTVETHDKQCITGNGSLVRLNNSYNFGSPTEFLIRPMWQSIDGNYSPWIAYLGCFVITSINPNQNKHYQTRNVEECYGECHNKNIDCGQNESKYFALKKSASQCFCLCTIHGLISTGNKCKISCSSDGNISTDNHFNVYTEYALENKIPDKICLVCSKVDENSNTEFNDFDSDGDTFGLCAEKGDMCYVIKENSSSLNYGNEEWAQQLACFCRRENEIITNNQTSGFALTTVDQSSEDITTVSVVKSSDETPTTPVMSPELSSKYPFEVSSSIPPLNSVISSDKPTTSNTDTVKGIVGLFVAVFALTSLVLFVRFYRKKRKHKPRDSQIDLQQLHSSQTVNNTYSDMMLAPGTNRNQNGVAFTATTNAVHNADIYMDNEDGEYDHLHTSRPKQVVSEMEDERYATSTQLEDVSYSTVKKCRKSVPDLDNDSDSITASLDKSCLSVANPNYEFCQHSS